MFRYYYIIYINKFYIVVIIYNLWCSIYIVRDGISTLKPVLFPIFYANSFKTTFFKFKNYKEIREKMIESTSYYEPSLMLKWKVQRKIQNKMSLARLCIKISYLWFALFTLIFWNVWYIYTEGINWMPHIFKLETWHIILNFICF